MSATPGLTAELRKEVLALEDDLRGRVGSLSEVATQWHSAYDAARAAERTAASWESWRDERVTLAAVAWVLTTVFVRFSEDNGLVKPVWITHAGGRGREATDAQAHFLRETARTNPDVTDREWLLEAVRHLRSLPATAGLVDDTSPLWLVSPSGDAASRILNFWRERNDDGRLVRDLTDSDLDTRFLGDLYQDISEAARKRYALLQTPVFVEEFILDRTLEPALAERPLEGFKAIDPTCGSGHFLLGIFARLLNRWHTHAPGMDERERVQAALDAVHGVDLNPYAVAVARFRLTVAALQACGMTRLEDAPAFKYHLASGDSLLHGLDQEEFDLGADLSSDRVAANFAYATENLSDLKRILRNGQYDCVVGNPPYIQPPDPALNVVYRRHYASCHRKYGLTVPFMERFFQLATRDDAPGRVGKITGSSFMTRVFGEKLVNDFLPSVQVDQLVDTKNLSLAGHGTPTIIMFGRAMPPVETSIGAVVCTAAGLGTTREDSQVWIDLRDCALARGAGRYRHADYVRVSSKSLWRHPVVLMSELERSLMEILSTRGRALGELAGSPGLSLVTGEEEAYKRPESWLRTRPALRVNMRALADGAEVRDWSIGLTDYALLYPYGQQGTPEITQGALNELWPLRRVLEETQYFGENKSQRGLAWYEYAFFNAERQRADRLAYPLVTDQAHFAFGSSSVLLDHSAPVAPLRGHDAIALGALNASTTWFFMKRTFFPKGHDDPEFDFHELDATKVKRIPVPRGAPSEETVSQLIARGMTAATRSVAGAPTRSTLDTIQVEWQDNRVHMVALQEELDWEVYRLYDLIDEDLTYSGDDLPDLALGERAFEIVLARKFKAGAEDTTWFDRHGSTPITEVPTHWPTDYQRLVERRIELIESHPYVRLLEKPEHKRRWAIESWEKQEERVLRGWLLDRLEDRKYWIDAHGRPTPKSVAMLADEVSRDAELVDVLGLWEGRPDVPVVKSLTKLLAKEGVPYLAAYRYKESGLRKRAAWEHTWDLQRREDAGTYDPSPKDRGGDGPIPVPPKYAGTDFTRPEYWSHRGKLDVAKERFILYPDAGRETDPTPVLGWAGWDHAHQALALAMLIHDRQDLDGWTDEQLVPLVAGLAELLPWVEQWHAEPSDLYGGVSPAEFFGQQLEERMVQVSATHDRLQAWRPVPATRGRKKKA